LIQSVVNVFPGARQKRTSVNANRLCTKQKATHRDILEPLAELPHFGQSDFPRVRICT
jgi:hypothetical protein